MTPGARITRFTALLGLLIQSAAGEFVSTTLNLVNEANVNELLITLSIPDFESSSDITNVSGTAEVALEIDPSTGTVTQLTFTGGSVTGTPISLNGNHNFGSLVGTYSFNSTDLFGTVNTPAPPGVVDNAPGIGDFDSARHEVIINGGVLSGSVDSLLGNQPVNQDFSTDPVNASGSGIGNVAAVFRGDLSSQTTSVYDLVVFVGVASTSNVDADGTTVTFEVSGTVKLAGQVSVPYLPLIFNFSPNPQIVADGDPVGLDYNVEGAASIDIDQGVGGVSPPSGTRTVTPPAGTDTTYTLTASTSSGSVTRSTMVRSVAPGPATFRYIRFTPVRLKGDLPGSAPADGIQMSEFQFFDGATPRVPLGAISPGENSPPGEGPGSLIDGTPAPSGSISSGAPRRGKRTRSSSSSFRRR
ncbi:MAG: hypothetical protein HKN82_20325 [Akkermansiaceae bacterium]|nr:hypothetical protein [Akkermansiaceae bacterium]NNM28175.1 hypothetical protein [Akkermansiaceae bacterium]